MKLKALEIQGFKSFPDKTRLEFDSGITAVVGPNGSGKSNIADAVRWVLGEQSTKTLRGGKMEDVIFGGTITRQPVGFAMVRLTIDNSDGLLAGRQEQVSVARRLYRSGESEYSIDGAAVRLRDIHELFMDTGLGRDGYSIIGQGKIAEIISVKGSQRRQIFEEAAGISKFRYRKEEAQRRLSESEDNLLRLRDILSELEGRVEPLRIQAEKANEFIALAEEKKTLELSLWMHTLDTRKKRLSNQDEKILIIKNDYERLELEGERLEAELAGLFEKSRELQIQAERQRGKVREMEAQRAETASAKAVMENDIAHNRESILRVQQQLAAAGQGTAALEVELAAKRQEQDALKRELEQMGGRIAAAEERVSEQKRLSAKTDEELRLLGVRRVSLQGAFDKLRLEQAASATRIVEGMDRLQTLRQSGHLQDDALRQLEQDSEECVLQQAEQVDRIESLENSRKGYLLKIQSRKSKRQELRQKAQELGEQARQKQARMKALRDLEAGMEGFSGSVKYILAQAGQGALRGVVGPVSSLITVEEQYTTAIETALGPALQNIVVQNEDVAKSAIRMLRDSKNGRATFLPLSSVSGRTLDTASLRGQQGYVGLACDLIQTDSAYAGVFAQLLGRVCIAEDMDAGSRIARKGGYSFRVVTLDGQVINAGGSYTGGSTVRSSGVLGRRREIEKLEQQIAGLDRDAAALAPGLQAVEEELSALEAAMSGIDGELQSAREEQTRLTYAGEQLSRSLRQAKENRDLARLELAALADRLEELRGSDSGAAQAVTELEEKLAKLIDEEKALGARRDTLAVGAEAASAALAEQRMAHLSAEKDYLALLAESERLSAQIASSGGLSSQLGAEREALEAKNAEILGNISQAEALCGTLTADIEQAGVLIQELLAQRTQLDGETSGLRAREREIAHNREGVSRELARLEEQRAAVQGEYDVIIARLWDEYELTRSQAAKLALPLESEDKTNRRLATLRTKIRALGAVNVDAIIEYKEVSERYNFLREQVADVESAIAGLGNLIADLTKEMRKQFEVSFEQIAAQFSRVFVQLFGGGHASLSLTPGEDVLTAGIEINVQPPGKVIRSLTLLSGGEQSFVAIAIYFAILKVRPAPFCIVDEIEAALDDVNVVKFAGYMRQMCEKTQFITITHRRGTMEEADVLYGVTMQDEGVSKLLALNINEVESKLGMAEPVTVS